MMEISSEKSVSQLTSNVVKLSVNSEKNTEIDLFESESENKSSISTPVFSQDAQRCSIPDSD